MQGAVHQMIEQQQEIERLRAQNALLVEEMRERPIYRKPYKEPTHKKECGTCIHSIKDFPLASNPMFCECPVPAWVEAKPKIKVDPSIAERCPTYTEVDSPF